MESGQRSFRRAVGVPASATLEKGTVVRLKGLSRPDLNDREGTITGAYSAQRGRYDVSLEGTDGLRVRPANLVVPTEARIACFVASHVDSITKLAGLQRCLESVKQQVFENLRMLNGAPGVQMQQVPPDIERTEMEESADERGSSSAAAHPAEYYDS